MTQAAVAPTELRLPIPPSTNSLFRNVAGRGRVKTADYKAWIEAAGWALRSQRPTKIPGRTDIEITIAATAKGDIDNRCKAVLDILVAHQVIDDDRYVDRLTISRSAAVKDCLVRIKPMEIAQ